MSALALLNTVTSPIIQQFGYIYHKYIYKLLAGRSAKIVQMGI